MLSSKKLGRCSQFLDGIISKDVVAVSKASLCALHIGLDPDSFGGLNPDSFGPSLTIVFRHPVLRALVQNKRQWRFESQYSGQMLFARDNADMGRKT